MDVRCVIIDDEPLSINVLEGYLNRIPNVEVVATFTSALPVISYLKEQPVDFILLDIEMPNLTGIEFIKSLNDPPLVIIVSANKDYAIEGYELNVVDYVLKPLTLERLLKAVNKIFDAVSAKRNSVRTDYKEDILFLKVSKKNVKVLIPDILYIESVKDYVRVVTSDKEIITKQKLSYFEKILNPGQFVRIHRSYIVAKRHIDAYTLSSVEIGRVEIPIGRMYRDNAVNRLGYQFEI